jgi:hypothetical protein
MQPSPPPSGASFPPPGWLTQDQAAQRLGAKRGLLHKRAFKWRQVLAEHAVRMPKPTGWSCVVYPVDLIERISAERAREAEARSPEGFVTRKQAIAMFNVTEQTWRHWTLQGKVPQPRRLPNGGKVTRTLYALADLDRMREVMHAQDKPHLKPDGSMHLPPGFIRRQTAWAMFGVRRSVWERWENEGMITCGVYIRPWPKLYPLEEIKRLLLEFGRLTPPYPDPQHPGCYRAPLAGRNIRRREVIVDEQTLPLIETGVCSWGGSDAQGHVKFTAPDGPQGVPLRRLILGVEEVIPPKNGSGERGGGIHIGHLNDDPLDCRRENLVVRTGVQRARHRRKNRTFRGQPTSSRFKGVCWVTSAKRWLAAIHSQGKDRRLGQFTDELAAAAAYDEAAKQWYGDHARLNFPDGIDAWLAAEAASGNVVLAKAA